MKRPIANSFEETVKKLEVCKTSRRGFVVVSMLVVSFAAVLLAAADVRAEQPGATQKQRWPAEKILPLTPVAKPAGAASTTRNISPHIRSRRSLS
jgi:hypothetical protein